MRANPQRRSPGRWLELVTDVANEKDVGPDSFRNVCLIKIVENPAVAPHATHCHPASHGKIITACFVGPAQNSNHNLWPQIDTASRHSANPVHTQLPPPNLNHNLETTSLLERTRHGRGCQSEQHTALSNACPFPKLRQECTQSHLGLRVAEELGNESPQLPCDSCHVEENQSRVHSRPVKRLLDVRGGDT